MSFQELCETLPSVDSVKLVVFPRFSKSSFAWCTWDEFVETAKDVEELNFYIKVLADGWWVEWCDGDLRCDEGWRVYRFPSHPELHFQPSVRCLER